jgi:uncharacterized protein YjbJ (UPF0337 family)
MGQTATPISDFTSTRIRRDNVMVRNQLEGIGHQLKGAVKKGLGNIIGDAKLAADGSAEQASGEAAFSSAGGTEQTFGIDPDRIKGVAHQLKGSFKAGLGRTFGNKELERDGDAERAAGKMQNEAGSTRDMAIELAGTVDATQLPPSG